TQISNDADNASKYYSPRGVAVNRNAGSPNFGRVYVSEAVGGPTASGRTTTDGLYILTADQGDVTGQGDVAWSGGIDWSGGTSTYPGPFKVTVAPDDRVFITDFTDVHSGVWTSPADGSGTFNELLDNTGRDSAGLVAGLHGTVPAVWVEGTGADTKMYTLDEDLDLGSTPGSILRYDIGTTQSGYNTPPVEETGDGTNVILNMRSDLVRDEDGSWWVAQYRSTENAGTPALTRWQSGGQAPIYNSGADDDLPVLYGAYGNLAIHDGMNLLAMGGRSGRGIYILDISDPDAPQLVATIAQTGYAHDVAFDEAGNLYVVSSSSETLRIWSPGGDWLAVTGSDGTFTLIPEPATLALLGLGGLALLRRRR
ncbi:MAG: PEP-CTERM sorting domain-containing protein, partial [Phycisphaerae bacterium]|nr:PEP-CTERM sorting domain-containing protein [Phycisphaerae bacterium]